MKELDKCGVESIFRKMDSFLIKKNTSKNFLIMGGAIVIYLGMPDRSTADLDFYGNKEDVKDLLKEMSVDLGLRFNPEEYDEADNPYIQWVESEFVHMPLSDEWKDDLEEVWTGEALKVLRPPLGVIIGSKLAASREKDIGDVKYLADSFPEWRVSLERYLPLFSKSDQQDIRENVVYLDFYLSSRPTNENPSVEHARVPFHRAKK